MEVTTLASALGAGANTSSNESLSQLSDDLDAFLQLLTAQVENQDPLEPLDSTEFVSQLAQLSQVEQSITMNQNLESILAALGAGSVMDELQLIGQTITVASDQIALEDGAAKYQYLLDAPAEAVSLTIRDQFGTTVREISGLETTSETLHSFTWNGRDDDGNEVLNGLYSVEITATDADGEAAGVTGYGESLVEEVRLESGVPQLVLANGAIVGSGGIIAVR